MTDTKYLASGHTKKRAQQGFKEAYRHVLIPAGTFSVSVLKSVTLGKCLELTFSLTT